LAHLDTTPIDPLRLYPFVEAARLIPSPNGGAVCLATLHAWRLGGLLPFAVERQVGRRSYWFLRGEDVLRLARGEELTREPAAASAVPRGRPSRAAVEAKKRAHGFTF
jgi:hypothetical protein